MATDEHLIKILKGEISEDELRKSFKEAGLDYDKMKKGAAGNEAFQKDRGAYQENKLLPESYKFPKK